MRNQREAAHVEFVRVGHVGANHWRRRVILDRYGLRIDRRRRQTMIAALLVGARSRRAHLPRFVGVARQQARAVGRFDVDKRQRTPRVARRACNDF